MNDINSFFQIFDFLKTNLLYFDYNLFKKYFIKTVEEVHIWTFINIIIIMIKIYEILKDGKKEEKLSFINENNYLSTNIFQNIIDDFEIAHI